ncbi:MAG: ergothioneine biosynthesis protein EgtC [Nocardioides sp.]
MCRHVGYAGPPLTLHDVVVAPPHALYEQSWAPRRQAYGTVNVDGFGAGWYVDGRTVPVRYRRAQPIWTDASFASLAPTVASPLVLAAVRSATPGTGPDESAAAPFAHDRWLLSHNGRLADWPTARKALAGRAADAPEALAPVDSALLFGLAVAAWQGGAPLADGLAEAVRLVEGHGGGRLTMLATDGTSLAGVVAGEPMWTRTEADGVWVASEPHDDDAGWRELPDRSLVTAGPDGLRTTSL